MKTLPRSPLPASKKLATGCVVLLFTAGALSAQVPDPVSPQQPSQPAPAAGGGSEKPRKTFLGQDVPSFDPGTEVMTWDGRSWNVNNNRLFQSRFEKYLNAPAETEKEDEEYRTLIASILDKLAPGNATTKNMDDGFLLLRRASNYYIDARLSDALADAVYSAWQAQNAGARIDQANVGLEEERKRLEWNLRMSANSGSISGGGTKDKEIAKQRAKEAQIERDARIQPYATRIAETLALLKANQVKKAANELQTKIQFQALIVQLFMQRRFQHVLMATRFYRAVFSDGDTNLKVGKDAKDLFSRSMGMPPTVGTLDSLANEAIRDVRESIQAYEYLLEQNELESATKRLAEAFTVGEYLPELRTLPREKKRRALVFTQKTNQLISAIDVKDYALAETLVKDLQEIAKDFDASKPMAMIDTSKMVAGMHLAKAKNAALAGNQAVLEAEIKSATEIWPRNPALAEVFGSISKQGDVQQQALIDFDQLLSQKNYRQIFENQVRYIAATALYPERQEQLREVLESMQTVEGAIIRSSEIAKQGNFAGAWESVERTFQDFPDDSRLNQVRANLTTQAADFVRTLRNAQQLEEKDQVGSSLAWFLKAQRIYPASEFAKDGISRMVDKIMPES